MPATLEGRRAVLSDLKREGTTHAGLWLDKYLHGLRLDGERSDKERDPGTWIHELLKDATGTAVPEGYRSAVERRRTLLQTLDGGIEGGETRLFVAEATGRIVIGLGTHALRETNITLLHTWGVPHLPGSALKGLASAAAHTFGEATWKKVGEPKRDHALLFGDTTLAGCVVFHDAWWMPELHDTSLPLDLDVMTVHHPNYYGRGGSEPPADWDEPTPIPFLTARGRYLVALSGSRRWIERASEWLSLGLLELGIGAKTRAGYGRMSLSRMRTQREIEEEIARQQYKHRLVALSNLPVQHKGAPTAKQHIQKLREAIEAGVPRRDIAAIAQTLFQRDPKFWKAWGRDAKRTDEERAFMEATQMVGGEPLEKKP